MSAAANCHHGIGAWTLGKALLTQRHTKTAQGLGSGFSFPTSAVLDALAAANAAMGAFDGAIETAERALTLTRDETLSRDIRQRVALYRQQRPFRLR